MDFGPASIDFWICRQSLSRVACEVKESVTETCNHIRIDDNAVLRHIQKIVSHRRRHTAMRQRIG